MINFQNYVYMVINTDYMNTLGVYPNFKKAYERLEEIAGKGLIIDCTGLDEESPSTIRFEIIRCFKDENSHHFYTDKYAIVRSLLTMRDNDTYISPYMVTNILEQNEKSHPRYEFKANIF